MVANIIAYLVYEDRADGVVNLYGYSREQIRGCVDIPWLTALPNDDLTVLLQEMVEMGILWSKPGSGRYRLSKPGFLANIGTEEEVLATLLAGGGGEAGC